MSEEKRYSDWYTIPYIFSEEKIKNLKIFQEKGYYDFFIKVTVFDCLAYYYEFKPGKDTISVRKVSKNFFEEIKPLEISAEMLIEKIKKVRGDNSIPYYEQRFRNKL